ncbi:MAG TPA: 50S ribosomal protein L23 [Acidimicrobiales bacterium]|nr:50S ribosomal protein L23 [Acidimicrobiales bacterium]
MDARSVIIRPVVSEKSYDLIEDNVYTFVVHGEANKTQIRQAVEEVFGVRVVGVNTLNRKGKRVRSRRTGTFTARPTTKRAIVTVHADDTIDLFEGA